MLGDLYLFYLKVCWAYHAVRLVFIEARKIELEVELEKANEGR